MLNKNYKKKRIIILGLSNFAKRRLLNSLKKIQSLNVEICSKTNKQKNYKQIIFDDYIKAINSNPDIIYISLINSLHYKYAKIALKKGIHVIVDKPITINHKDTLSLLSLAKKNNVLLAEATLFNYHKVFKEISKISGGYKNIQHTQANFNIPQIKNDKIIKEIKGDCLNEMSSYCAALIRILFNKFSNKNCNTLLIDKNNINKNFYVNYYQNNKSFFGNFGIDMEYISQIIFYTNNKIIYLNHQSFALPADKKIELIIKSEDIYKKIIVEKDDCIKNFIEVVLKCLKNKTYNHFYNLLFLDSKIRSSLKN